VCHGAERLLVDFLYDETQRPIVGQIYGTTPDFFRQTAIALCFLGFDGIDINMGCPAKNVAHSGAGAALIRTPELAVQIIRATQEGIAQWCNEATLHACPDITPAIAQEIMRRHALLPPRYQERRMLPVSVKTRIGYDQPVLEHWIPTLLSTGIAAIALHGRTLKQQYGGEASWEHIGEAAAIVRTARAGGGVHTRLLGNGDITSRADALAKCQTYGTDGALIGRATFGNPFALTDQPEQIVTQRFVIALEHARLFEATYGGHLHFTFLPMRKHLGWYVRGVANASELRQAIYQTNSAVEFSAVLERYGIMLSSSGRAIDTAAA
jgi:tRNA-dihydrouridine synthase